MEILPVVDLKGGRAVRGRSGERASYQPVVSRLRGAEPEDLSDPVALLRACREAWDVNRAYVADLDRIAGAGDNRASIERLADAEPGLELLLDKGASDDQGARRVSRGGLVPIVATETMRSLQDLAVPATRAQGGAMFGLDVGPSGVVARSREVTALTPADLLRRAAEAGFTGAIVLFLGRVGTGAGLPRDLLRSLRQTVPGFAVWVGGGIATRDDLEFLRVQGYAGALVGTALHEGWIKASDLRPLGV